MTTDDVNMDRRVSVVRFCTRGRVLEKIKIFNTNSIREKEIFHEEIKVGNIHVKDIRSKFEKSCEELNEKSGIPIVNNRKRDFLFDNSSSYSSWSSGRNSPFYNYYEDKKPHTGEQKTNKEFSEYENKNDSMFQEHTDSDVTQKEPNKEGNHSDDDLEPKLEQNIELPDLFYRPKLSETVTNYEIPIHRTMIGNDNGKMSAGNDEDITSATKKRRERLQRWSSVVSSSLEESTDDEGYQEIGEYCTDWINSQPDSERELLSDNNEDLNSLNDDADSESSESIMDKIKNCKMRRGDWRTSGLRRQKVSTEACETTRNHSFPWRNSEMRGEHYQNYTRTSELMMSQIESQYDESNYHQLASYFLIRKGHRISFNFHGSPVPAALDLITGPRKTLWQNIPEVLNSNAFVQMSKAEIHLQEAIFEIVSSEGSYVYSLSILETHFLNNIKYQISRKMYNKIFSKIEPIIKAAKEFLGELLKIWHNDIMLKGLCEVLETYYQKSSELFLRYARHSEDIITSFAKEKETNQEFQVLINEFAECAEADHLPVDSFLNLPLQRITRIPLLLNTVIAQAPDDHPEYYKYKKALATAQMLAQNCNDEVGRVRQWEEILKLTQELTYPLNLPNQPLATSERVLILRSPARRVKHGNFTVNKKEHLELFLFNDLFLYAAKCSEKLEVRDYCPRAAFVLKSIETVPSSTELTLLANSKGEKRILTVLFDRTSDRQRWITALTPQTTKPGCTNDDPDRLRQVIVLHKHEPLRTDELTLEIGDVLDVLQEQDDWYIGDRLMDGAVGWIPKQKCKIITSPAIRKLNIRIRKDLRLKGSQSISLDRVVTGEETEA